jgi:hypothetical protein
MLTDSECHEAEFHDTFVVEALLIAIYLPKEDVYIYTRPNSPSRHLGPAQPNLYEPASSNRNAAYSQQHCKVSW